MGADLFGDWWHHPAMLSSSFSPSPFTLFALSAPVVLTWACGGGDVLPDSAAGATATGVAPGAVGMGGEGTAGSSGGSPGMPTAGQGMGGGPASGGTTNAGAPSTSGSGGGAMVSYSRQVKPIFESAGCALCHHAASAIDINIADPFDPDNGLVGSVNTWAVAHPEGMTPQLNVAPGDVAGSFLVQKISDPNIDVPSAGEFMPWTVPRLTDAEVADLRTWITNGAANDDFFASNIRRIFGDETRLGAAGGKCTYCHYAGGQPPNLTDPFDSATGAVGVASLLSSKVRIAPGDPDESFLIEKVEATTAAETVGAPMPYPFPALTAEQIAVVVAWIEQGANDD